MLHWTQNVIRIIYYTEHYNLNSLIKTLSGSYREDSHKILILKTGS